MNLEKAHSAIYAGIAAMFAIGLLSIGEFIFSCTALIMAPLGASAVLVFGVPDSPLAQPKNVIFGHLLTAFIGLAIISAFGVSPFTLALATGLAVSAMLLTNTTHPPAGANPLLIMMTEQTWSYLLTPVLTGAVVIVITGLAAKKLHNKLLNNKSAYP
ncbi:HPP family protein [Thalassotalea marina]|uniref:HPP family protein n=1 Tax=Thalassotalea marina TaxID=1673741 RepID=A0A919EPG8_9GAMM|nr:HPP family protein [Thalassotalea marina]GHG05222.1 HPP family protein [Thalassotalea marina]